MDALGRTAGYKAIELAAAAQPLPGVLKRYLAYIVIAILHVWTGPDPAVNCHMHPSPSRHAPQHLAFEIGICKKTGTTWCGIDLAVDVYDLLPLDLGESLLRAFWHALPNGELLDPQLCGQLIKLHYPVHLAGENVAGHRLPTGRYQEQCESPPVLWHERLPTPLTRSCSSGLML